MVDSLGWQQTLLIVSIIFLMLGVPTAFIMRSRPQDYGMVPDGRVVNDEGRSRQRPSYDFATSIKEAVKMRVFWHMAMVTLFQGGAVTTIQLYAMPYLTGLGLSRTSSSMVVMLYTAISLPMRVFLGMASDRFKRTHVIGFTIAMQASGMFVFWLLSGKSPFWLILLFAITYGIGVAGNVALRAPLVAEYFGTKNFGAIYGFTGIWHTVAQIGFQPLVGWIYDTYHDYRIWWLVVVGMGVMALISMLTIPAPRTLDSRQ